MAAKSSSLGKELTKYLFNATNVATQFKHEYITLEHILYALIEDADIKRIFKELKVDETVVKDSLVSYFESEIIPMSTYNEPRQTIYVRDYVAGVTALAIFASRDVTTTDMLFALCQMEGMDIYAVSLLNNLGLTILVLKEYLSHGKTQQHPGLRPDDMMGPQQKEITNIEEARAFLAKYTTNLNDKAKEGKIDPLIGRLKEVQEIIKTSARRSKNNSVLCGEPGVGKTVIVEGLALAIVKGDVPEIIKKSEVFSMNVGDMVAGTRFRGDFEERMKFLLQALTFIESPILFIDEIHTIMGAGSGNQGAMDVANLLKPALAKGSLRCIGSTTLKEYQQHFEKDRALVRRFRKIIINEPSVEETKLVLRGLRSYYEKYHKVKFSDDALDAAAELSAKYINNQYLPDKAIDLIDNAGAQQAVLLKKQRVKVITRTEIEAEISTITKIPAKDFKKDESEKLANLNSAIKEVVFGQDVAIDELTDAVLLARAGLRELNKPQGCYLLPGPTGTGKTEVARRLADLLNIPLVKFNMSEYMEKHTVSKLIGSPPGYVGHGDGAAGSGLLTSEIDKNGHCVLLLDEVEKAHPDIFNIFLQVMDDGCLTDSTGKTVSFRNVILMMTSNAGASELSKNRIGFGATTNDDADSVVIEKMFSPEFRNRLDAIIKFKSLEKNHILMIVDKFINTLNDLTVDKNVKIELTQEAKEWLAEKGYDRKMGARPLGRVIQENIKKPLSKLMLFGSLKNGGKVTVTVVDNKIVLN